MLHKSLYPLSLCRWIEHLFITNPECLCAPVCVYFVLPNFAALACCAQGCVNSGLWRRRISFANQNAKVTIDENKDGTVWIVKATPSGRSSAINYTIVPGKDGELFKIDETTGALSFKQPPDFETPLMCSTTIVMRWIFKPVLKLKILARVQSGVGHFVAVHAQQLVLIQVKDVSNPILTVISPLHYA